PARVLDGTGLARLPRRAPHDRHPEGPEDPDLPAGSGPAPPRRRARPPGPEAATLSDGPGRPPSGRRPPARTRSLGAGRPPGSGVPRRPWPPRIGRYRSTAAGPAR